MKLLSLNRKGLESIRKKLSLKRMIQVQNPDIILLQETLGSKAEVSSCLSSISSNFSFLAQSAKGLSGGLEIGWNPSTLRFVNSWGASFSMGLEIFWEEANLLLNVIKIYGPYNNRVAFWESVQAS